LHSKQRVLRPGRMGLLLIQQEVGSLLKLSTSDFNYSKTNKMKTETKISPALKEEVNENKINYLWLNGERVTGIEGLEIFEDCKQLHHLPAIDNKQRNELNSIVHSALERYEEEGICNYWPCLAAKAKEYFSKKGYCVTSQGEIKFELRQSVEVTTPSSFGKTGTAKVFTQANLWNIHRMRRVRLPRRYIGG
jgi:hypothetical protein